MKPLKALKMACITTTSAAAALVVLSIICAKTIQAAPLIPSVTGIPVTYHCDEGQTLVINYVFGATQATLNGQVYQRTGLYETSFEHEGDPVSVPVLATQYDFMHDAKTIHFVTGKGQTDAGALLVPDSDDFYYCEAQNVTGKFK